MNAIRLFQENALLTPRKMAISSIDFGILSFEDISNISARVQALAKKYRLSENDSVLVALTPSPLLYGVICGLMGLGVRIIFIEPWLSLDRINHVLKEIRPRLFLSGTIGRVWGIRSAEIRNIPHWISPGEILSMEDRGGFQLRELRPDHHAFVVFSSGTTGAPKGVVRTHQYMQNIYDVFTALEPQNFKGPDLIIFPNVALFHLATGRGSVIVPNKWSVKNLNACFDLCDHFGPDTISTGPAFLKTLLDTGLIKRVGFLDRVVVGGALSDCWLLEKIFEELPGRRFLHLYGGSEAEPVTVTDARESVKKSREKGFFQALSLGKPIPQLQTRLHDEILWVSGPNVAGEYIGDESQNKGIKERDEEGNLWHCMGDRISEEKGEFWLMGRAHQPKDDFLLEQKIYTELQSSKSFIIRQGEKRILLGEGIRTFPGIDLTQSTTIVRDKRHRSRINRQASTPRRLRGLT